eukprot:TRINITY_DN13792_c0_g1_i1.p1 TRINITY_DN13792_c0_g1~~TRINITY_DN13792_c0_g1_i1.p1  ORF type:complete len:300 (-),score=78.57 TRINITY_DN13792_c0_g1_i1:131-1030(-)
MSSTNQDASLIGRHKFRSNEISVLKLCVKYKPPSLALYYIAASLPDKKFMHSIEIAKEIQAKLSPCEIYNKLLEREPGYWNDKKVPKTQVMSLIEKLLGKNILLDNKEKPPLTSKNLERLTKEQEQLMRGKGYETLLSVGSSTYGEPMPAADFAPSKSETTSKETTLEANPKLASVKELSRQAKPKAPELLLHNEMKQYREDDSEQSDDLSEDKHEAAPASDVHKLCQEIIQSKSLPNLDRESQMKSSSNDSVESSQVNIDLNQLEKVFVEDLGKEMYMDGEGNLYDMDGNYVGQAEDS